MAHLKAFLIPSTQRRTIYFLSDFAGEGRSQESEGRRMINAAIYHPSSSFPLPSSFVSFKRNRKGSSKVKKKTPWTAEREARVKRGKDGRFGSIGKAADALTNTPAKKAAIAGATLIGVPAATYLAMKARYEQGIPQSANMVKTQASSIKVPDLDIDKEQVTFAIGGFDGNNLSSNTMQKSISKQFKNHHVVSVPQGDYNVKTQNPQASPAAFANWSKDVCSAFYETVGKEGRNPAAVNLAANAYAYHLKYPGKPINIVGHSAGGMVASEASDILESLGVKTKTVALGSPYFGITKYKNPGNTITILNDTDPIKNLPLQNGIVVKQKRDKTNGHFLPSYLTNKEVLKEMRRFLSV